MDALLKTAVDGAIAFGELVKIYRPGMVRTALWMLNNEQDAEDAVQEALIDALLGLSTYDESRGDFKQWLASIVRNKCKQLRRERDAVPTVALDEAIGIAGGDPLEILEIQETANEARAAIAKLPKAQREAFELYADGKSAKEIACVMGITTHAAEIKVSKARKRIREQLLSFCE